MAPLTTFSEFNGEVMEENTAVIEDEKIESEQVEGETPDAEVPEDDELVVSIGDAPPASEEEPEARAPEWVRELRKTKREQDRELRELRQKLADKEAAAKPVTPEVVKPTLEGCDYDAEAFDRKVEAWSEQQRRQGDSKR